ncbi:MAG: hypothetical protein IGS39_01075 [Calothrix sp. C42_A2020_038]|nr:hypothetical protein [Calothrix sp. C42_A2020_038]
MLRLLIPKKYGNYADTFFLLGLARVIEYALKESKQKSEIQLIDQGTHYCIQFKKCVNLEPIAKIKYTSPFPVVKGKNTDISNIPEEANIFDTVEHDEARKVYHEFMLQQRGKERTEESPQPPDPRTQNGAILTSMRHDRNHNNLWLDGWKLRNYFGALIVALLEGFSKENATTELVAEFFETATGCKLPNASAVKIYLPNCVQGVNRVKADSNKVDSQKTDWLSLWLIANGLFNFGVAQKVKIAKSFEDWRLVALQPYDISLSKYEVVLKNLIIYNPPTGKHGAARFDAELVLKFCQELLNYNRAAAENKQDDFDDWDKPVNHFVNNFAGTHFGSKGQVYGVKEVFSLGLPAWICPHDYNELLDYQNVLNEHLNVVRALSIDDGHSELIAAYRDFISGNDLYQFFRFQVSYADYITKKLAGANARVALFSKQGLNLMIKNLSNNRYRQDDGDLNLTKIIENQGFLNIAKAINSATVYAGTICDKDNHTKDTGWERIYGLAQRLSSQSGSKKDFIIEIMSFLASYENENLRIDDDLRTLKKPRRIWTTKDDLDELIHLIDKYGSSLIANLLIAYGYAKGWGKSKDEDTENIKPAEEP